MCSPCTDTVKNSQYEISIKLLSAVKNEQSKSKNLVILTSKKSEPKIKK